ncbi:MAG: AbrB/MazE/SpoVT family DNA-binding domain-containing protein [Nitrososphaeria archaeon]
MSQVLVSKVGKKGAIYIPKRVCEELGIKEEDKVLMKVEGGKLVLEFIPDPLSLAVKIRKWTKTTVEEFEKESEEEQNQLSNN